MKYLGRYEVGMFNGKPTLKFLGQEPDCDVGPDWVCVTECFCKRVETHAEMYDTHDIQNRTPAEMRLRDAAHEMFCKEIGLEPFVGVHNTPRYVCGDNCREYAESEKIRIEKAWAEYEEAQNSWLAAFSWCDDTGDTVPPPPDSLAAVTSDK